jgi:hypothetical protein
VCQIFKYVGAGTSEPEAKRAKTEEKPAAEADAEVDEGKKKEPGTKGLVEGNFDDDDEEDEDFEGELSAVRPSKPAPPPTKDPPRHSRMILHIPRSTPGLLH